MATIGRLLRVGIAKETTRGTAPASAAYWIPHSDLSFDDKAEVVFDESARGVLEDALAGKITRKWAEGSWEAPIGVDHFGLVLLATFGSVNTSGAGTTKTHEFSILESVQHPTLAIFTEDSAGGDRVHALGAIGSLEVNVEVGALARYGVEVQARAGASATNTPADTTETQFTATHASVVRADDLAGLDTGTALEVRRVRISIAKNVEPKQVLGSVDPADYLTRNITIEGEMEVVWEDGTDRDLFLAGTPKAMRVRLVDTSTNYSGGGNPEVAFDLARVVLTSVERALGLNDVATATIAFRGTYSLSDGVAVKAKLVNEVASY